MSAAYTLANRSVSDRRAELDSVQSQVETAQAQVQRYASYTGFTALRQKRTETVRSLAASRFDWSHALHELARTIPSNAWLTSLKGTVAPGRHDRRRQQRSAARVAAEPRARDPRAAPPARPTSPRSSRACAAWTASSA